MTDSNTVDLSLATTVNEPITPTTLAKIDEAVDKRTHINENLWPKMRGLGVLYKHLFMKEAGDLKLLSDAVYYEDGVYPNEDSVARWKTLTRKFARMFILLSHIEGESKVTTLLKDEFGLSVESIDDTKNFLSYDSGAWDKEEVREILAQLSVTFDKSMNSNEILKKMVEDANSVQSTICGASNELKDVIIDDVIKLEPHLKRGHVNKVVGLKITEARRARRKNPKSKKEEELNSTGRFLEVLDVAVPTAGETNAAP